MSPVVRNIPNPVPRGALPVTVALGMVLPLTAFAASLLGEPAWVPRWIVFVTPPVVLGAWGGVLALATRRVGSGAALMLAGWIAFSIALGLGYLVRVDVPFFQPFLLGRGALLLLILALVVGPGMVLSLLAWGLARCVVSPADGGGCCWRCRYDRTGLTPGSVCPECGSPAEAPASTAAVLLSRRAARRIGWAACILAVAGPASLVGVRYVVETMPRYSAAAKFGVVQRGWVHHRNHGVLGGEYVGRAVRPLRGVEGGVLVLEVWSAADETGAAVRIYSALETPELPTPPGPYRPSDPLIYCDLTMEQFLSLDKEGVETIEAAFLAQAEGLLLQPLGCELYDYGPLGGFDWDDSRPSDIYRINVPNWE